MPKNLTPEVVTSIYKEVASRYGVIYKSKADSDFMALVGAFLDGIGVMDKETFLTHFTTTIGSTIYTPYTIGVDGGGSGYSLWGQITVLAHEVKHAVDYQAAPAEFMLLYVVNPSDRAEYEARAYSVDLELQFWNNKVGYNTAERAKSLLSYGLKQEHCDFAAAYLDTRLDILKQGGEIDDIAKTMKQLLLNNGVLPDR